MKRKIVYLTGTRAEFGKIKPLIQEIIKLDLFDVSVFVTGMHMSEKYGYTGEEILKLGFPHVYQYINDAEHGTMDTILAHTIEGIGNYVKLFKPDMIVIHGDRVEALAGAIVGALNNILVAHIEGGEISGTVDEIIRHAISKLAHIHFVSNTEAKRRLQQLGEDERHIYIIGSPDLDIMSSPDLPTLTEAKQRYEIPFSEYAILGHHPVTTELHRIPEQTEKLVDALIASGLHYIVIYPNNDHGNDLILSVYREKIMAHPRFRIFPSMRFEHYLTFLQNALFIIGNSSAGIREAPFFGVPTINIGSRQANRIPPDTHASIFHCDYHHETILDHIRKFSQLTRFPPNNHFGDGKSTERFLTELRSDRIWQTGIQKQFRDFNISTHSQPKSEILGIVPARGGSKSIPRKNIKLFCDKPLLAWTIDACVRSGKLDRLILSTDDAEIADIGRHAGADVPFLRPTALAQDHTPSLAVLQHAIQWLKENQGYLPAYVVLLEPTSPGRMHYHIREAIELLLTSGADSVVSVTEVPGHFNPHWQFVMQDTNMLKLYTDQPVSGIVPRRQELPKTYYRNGAIYALKTELLLNSEPSLYGKQVRAYVMDGKYSLDIDTPEDWEKAEHSFLQILAEQNKKAVNANAL
ncbi:MAG: UDP-N-acetylglucosamine 2-epimerase [Patescibacteria group bacterium]